MCFADAAANRRPDRPGDFVVTRTRFRETLFSTLLPVPPLTESEAFADIGALSTIDFPVITWLVEGVGGVPPSQRIDPDQ